MSSSDESDDSRSETISQLVQRQTRRLLRNYPDNSLGGAGQAAGSETPSQQTRNTTEQSFVQVDSDISFRRRPNLRLRPRRLSLPSSNQTTEVDSSSTSPVVESSCSESDSIVTSSLASSESGSLDTSQDNHSNSSSSTSLFSSPQGSSTGTYETLDRSSSPILSPNLSVETLSLDSAEEGANMADARLNAIANGIDQVRANMSSNGLKPDPFNGDLEANHTLFLSHFNAYANSLGWNDAAKVNHLPLFLRSSAFVDFMAQPDATRNNWAAIETYLNNTYGSADRKYIWRNMLTSRTLQPGEKIAQYAQEIRDLCQRLQLDEQHMVSFFIKGLPRKYSTILAPLQPENINSALQKLSLFLVESEPDTYDNNLLPLSSQRPKIDSLGEGVQQALLKVLESREKESAELKKKLEKLESKLDSSKVRQVKAIKVGSPNEQTYYQPPPLLPPPCQLCGAGDHLAPMCPSLYNKSSPQQTYNSSRPMQRTQNVRRCFICNSPDHFKRDCPHDAYNNAHYQRPPGSRNYRPQESGYYIPAQRSSGDINHGEVPKNGQNPHNG